MLVKYLRTSCTGLPLTKDLSLAKSIYSIPSAYFARKVSSKPKLSEKMEKMDSRKIKPSKPDLGIPEDNYEERADPKSVDIDEQFIAKNHLDAQHLPEKFLKRIHKVFAKFPHSEVRDMGKSYMKMYQLLHAAEKPMDITQLKPFANTAEIIDPNNQKMIYLGKKFRHHEEKPVDEQKKKEKEAAQKAKKEAEGEDQPSTATDTGIIYDQNTALAYLQRKVPHTFGVACRVLTEMKFRLPDFKPETFLDFGAGLGSGAWAFSDIFRDFKKIVAIEPSTPMRKLGKYLTEDLQKIVWFDSLARLVNVHDIDGQFDVVYCGYVLEEVKNPEARMLIIETLWQKVKPNGIMILVEPGSPKGFRFIYSFRQWIVEKSREEANIVAPCPHHGECPQAKQINLWCNFDQPIAKYPNKVFTKLKQQKTIDNERFSFLVVKKGEIPTKKEEATTPAEKSFFWSRIIRPTLKRDKHILIDVCNLEGAIERIIVAKSHGVEGGYNYAKEVRWGDLWCFPKRIPNKYRKESKLGERLW